MSNSNLRQLEGGRAAKAFEFVQNAQNQLPEKNRPAYKAYVKKLPMLIKTNGLGAAYAFVLSKKDESQQKKGYAYKLIYDQTQEWLASDNKKFLLRGKENQDLVKVLTELNSHEYRAVTVEVLALLNWLRRFAEGLIEGDETDVDDQN